MPSFYSVNYSLRPSKSIQRQIVFDGVREVQRAMEVQESVYIGLGSVWFVDFVMAHKVLGIEAMVSIEEHEVGHARACFNSPYATVDVRHGLSSDVLPKLFVDGELSGCPWVIWLDFDGSFDDDVKHDVRSVIEECPENSVFVITFNAEERMYGRIKQRLQNLRQLFEDVVPDELSVAACGEDRMQDTLAKLSMDFMKSIAAEARRPGGFVPAFRLIYGDGASMVTVGGVLPAKERSTMVEEIVGGTGWRCRPDRRIEAPLLTIREAMALQSQLPNSKGLSREVVRSLGFDLEEEQIEVYQRYYREYPSFAQIVT